MRLASVVFAAVLATGQVALAAELAPSGPSQQGRINFVFVGGSFTNNAGLSNGVNCINKAARARVASSDLPPAYTLLSATLYVGGSLIEEFVPTTGSAINAEDYPGVKIFSTGRDCATTGGDLSVIESDALAQTDRTVSFKPPGAAAAVSVTATRPSFASALCQLGLYQSDSGYTANFAFTVTPIDVTAAIVNESAGKLEGEFVVSDFTADVCYGAEVICGEKPPPYDSCATAPGSATHIYGGASFALVLVVEDASLPLRSITIYDGLQKLYREQTTKTLHLDNPISSPAAGSLAFYALEGDIMIPANPVSTGPCSADEYIEVDGDADPATGGLCLEDADNPKQNIFNASINVQPASGPKPICTADAAHRYQCCLGPGLCNVVGVDIDRFDISKALASGQSDVRITMGTGEDRISLATMVVGIDVFAADLSIDSQIRVLSADTTGNVQLGGPVVYSVAVSNTGNVAADGVDVSMAVPAGTTNLRVIGTPDGSTDASSATGGPSNRGLVHVQGFRVEAGEVAEVRFTVDIGCALEQRLVGTATIAATSLAAFSVSAPSVATRGPGATGSACANIDITGPFASTAVSERVLRGNGCAATSPSLGMAFGLATLLAFVRARRCSPSTRRRSPSARRRGPSTRRASSAVRTCLYVGVGATLSALAATSYGCGKTHVEQAPPPPPSKALADADNLPGVACATPLMALITMVDGTAFCIDRFEAALDDGARGAAHQGGGNDTVLTTDGSTTASATEALGVYPATRVSWYQATAACANAGKRLCSIDEWEFACRGPSALTYPYGATVDDAACAGFFSFPTEKPMRTGGLATCGSAFGVYDLSGNVEEWTATAVERQVGGPVRNDRAVRGGGFHSNAHALACAGPEFHTPPGAQRDDLGFRCCAAAP